MFINDQYDFCLSRDFSWATYGFIDRCTSQGVWTTLLDVVRLFCAR